jgi:YfiH family protein
MPLQRRARADSQPIVYLSPLLQEAGVPHAFSTRSGGVSQGPFASLNLGTLSNSPLQDDLAHVRENYRRLLESIGASQRERCWIHQVHGRDVVVARPGQPFESGVKADAIVTDDASRVVSVKYADCVPILLATPDGRAVAAIHAGWRGVVAGVVPAAAQRLAEIAHAKASELLAAVGPCISMPHFEVGPEVLDQLSAAIPDLRFELRPGGSNPHVDLADAVRRQLLAAGFGAGHVDATDRCTYRDADEFFSHRRDRGVTGRMAAVIGPRGAR